MGDTPSSEPSRAGGDFPRRGRGRPPGSKNKKRLLGLTESEQLGLDESRRILQPELGLTANQVVNRSQIKTAVKGGTNAQKAHLDRIDRLEQKQRDAIDKLLLNAETYVFLHEDLLARATFDERMRLEKRMLPHPADVEVDFIKREVRILGPMNTLERREWNSLKAGLAKARTDILELRLELEEDPTDTELADFYTVAVCKYLDACEILPPRHRPEKLGSWKKIDDITWN